MKNIKIKSLKVIVFLLLFLAAVSYANNNPSTTIPKNFYVYKDSLKLTTDMYIGKLKLEHMNSLNYYPYFSGLIEHESCIPLTHSRCWSAKAELNTKWPNGKQREQGIGFGQITRAYTEAGSIRLDVLNDLKKRFKTILICFDRDVPGVQNMRKVSLKTGLKGFLVHKSFKAKDISDAVKTNGFESVKDWLKKLLWKYC